MMKVITPTSNVATPVYNNRLLEIFANFHHALRAVQRSKALFVVITSRNSKCSPDNTYARTCEETVVPLLANRLVISALAGFLLSESTMAIPVVNQH
jgi:hypothetical protein